MLYSVLTPIDLFTLDAIELIYIYTSTIKSPSAVQISKSIKQTQSEDKI